MAIRARRAIRLKTIAVRRNAVDFLYDNNVRDYTQWANLFYSFHHTNLRYAYMLVGG